jgi:hypothetical protein
VCSGSISTSTGHRQWNCPDLRHDRLHPRNIQRQSQRAGSTRCGLPSARWRHAIAHGSMVAGSALGVSQQSSLHERVAPRCHCMGRTHHDANGGRDGSTVRATADVRPRAFSAGRAAREFIKAVQAPAMQPSGTTPAQAGVHSSAGARFWRKLVRWTPLLPSCRSRTDRATRSRASWPAASSAITGARRFAAGADRPASRDGLSWFDHMSHDRPWRDASSCDLRMPAACSCAAVCAAAVVDQRVARQRREGHWPAETIPSQPHPSARHHAMSGPLAVCEG